MIRLFTSLLKAKNTIITIESMKLRIQKHFQNIRNASSRTPSTFRIVFKPRGVKIAASPAGLAIK